MSFAPSGPNGEPETTVPTPTPGKGGPTFLLWVLGGGRGDLTTISTDTSTLKVGTVHYSSRGWGLG